MKASHDTSCFHTLSISIVRKAILGPRECTQGQPVSTRKTTNKVILELHRFTRERVTGLASAPLPGSSNSGMLTVTAARESASPSQGPAGLWKSGLSC